MEASNAAVSRKTTEGVFNELEGATGILEKEEEAADKGEGERESS
jgi:hypothetical protein